MEKTTGPVGQFGVHGVQSKRDWPCLTEAEIQAVAAQYPDLPPALTVSWNSMRPFSAAVRIDGETCAEHQKKSGGFLIKRHHASLRGIAALQEEHAFMRHLHQHAVPVCLPCVARSGVTALALGEWTYEVFPLAAGQDVYRDVMSWQPYKNAGHAMAAGRALAQLHKASASYPAPGRGGRSATGLRAGRPLTSSLNAIAQPDLLVALQVWAALQPGLMRQLAHRSWLAECAAVLVPLHDRLKPYLATLPTLWGHGDWHGSNLFWQQDVGTHSPAEPQDSVSCVLDFGMADRTSAMFDLAVALERSMIDWLDPAENRHVFYTHMAAFLNGYAQAKPLAPQDWAELGAFLPLVHVEFALSEVAYFGTLLQDAASAEVAYTGYLLGHARWFATGQGRAVLAWLDTAAQDPQNVGPDQA